MECAECGFTYDSATADNASDTVRGFGDRYRIQLTRGLQNEDLARVLRAHPLDGTWSALEYACHVRDVLAVQRDRIARALAEDLLVLQPMRRDDLVAELEYNEQDPTAVANDLNANAGLLADALTGLSASDWDHPLVYHDQGQRTVLWVAQHTVHEGEHHLLDIGRVSRAARGR